MRPPLAPRRGAGATGSRSDLMRSFLAPLALSLLAPMAALAEDYPLRLTNCGYDLTLAARPERIVAIKSTAAELVLALGAGERLVGTGFLDAPLPEGAPEIPVLSQKMPASEVVLGTAPDLVYAGWESAFTGEAAGERSTLSALGIASYVAPSACRSTPLPKLTFEALFDEIAEMGRILGTKAEAADLIRRQQDELAKITPDPRGLTALWYSSGVKVPYVGAGHGAPELLLEALGLTNIFAEVGEGWVSASWEAVIDADPDIIVLVDADWNSAEQKRRVLAENPLTAALGAVRNQHYLVIPFPASEAGVRSIPALSDLARQLADLDLRK